MTQPRKPLFWHQGLFLQPQHLQQFDRYIQSLLTPLNQHKIPFFWGVNDIHIQHSALQNRMFEISQGELIFQDGTWTVFPGNAVVQSRSFEDVSFDMEGEKPFRVYLGLRKWNSAGKNVTATSGVEDLYTVATRYTCPIDPEQIEDLHGDGPSAHVRLMNYVLKLFWETEIEGLGNYWLIPIAQIELEGDSVRLSRDFVPPTVSLSGSKALMQLMKSIQEQLVSRSRILEMYKIYRDADSSDLGGATLRYLFALAVANRYVPLLHHMIESPSTHPWVAYGTLRQLIGELSTFTDRINALGKLQDGTELLPGYDHNKIGTCFNDALTLISELLNAIVVGEENIVHLIRDGNYFTGFIPPEGFSDRNLYFLAITASGDPDMIKNSLLNYAKIGEQEQMPTLLDRALPGIPLEQRLTPPPGLPKRSDSYYFSLEPNHPQWIEIRRTGNICLYWDEASENATGDLLISRM